MSETLLTLNDIHLTFPAQKNWRGKVTERVYALNGLDMTASRGETLGIVGESGCGKSTLAKLLMGILKPSSGQFSRAPAAGEKQRGRMQMVFQDPLSSLDPRLPVWRTITEPVWIQSRMREKARRDLAEQLAHQVGIRPEYLDRLPHAFSGGQRQRIAIARALSSQPEIIVLDEPTSALDISVQAQILNLLRQVQEDFGPAYLFISHDLAVVGFMCPHILVMYLGRFVEEGPRERLLREPAHPYTRALLASVPSFEDLRDGKSPVRAPQQNIRGELPSPLDPPSGCRFHPRCPQATERCREEAPQWKELEPGWRVRCHLYG